MSLGKNISRLRHEKGFTRQELAKRAGISKSYLNRIEEDSCPRPHLKTIARIATALTVSIEEFELDRHEK